MMKKKCMLSTNILSAILCASASLRLTFAFLRIATSLGLIFGVAHTLTAAQADPMQEAAFYYDAGEYDHALDVYKKLLETSLTPWQNAVVQYNIGSTLLAQGKLHQAQQQLLKIPLGADPHPLLLRRIQTNMALSLILEANRFTPDTLDKIEKSLFDYQKALLTLDAAENADCQLAKISGPSFCPLAADLEAMRRVATIGRAHMYEQLSQMHVAQATLKGGAPFLLNTMQQLMAGLDFMENHPMSQSLTSNYVHYYTTHANEWIPLWKSLAEQLPNEASEYQKSFQQAKHAYQQGIDALQAGILSKARQYWSETEKWLNEIIAKSLGADPAQEVLRKLLAFYAFVSVQNPLQESTLLSLQLRQNQVLKALKEPLQKQLQPAQTDLEVAIAAIETEDVRRARFYLEEAQYLLRSLLNTFELPSQNEPLRLIHDLVDAQAHVLTLNRLRLTIQKEGDPELIQRVEEAQQRVLAAARQFLPAVWKWEEMAFQQPVANGNGSRCQDYPWVEALPLFSAGMQAVQETVPIQGIAVTYYQEEALAKWQRVLDVMKQPIKASQGSCQGPQPAQGEKGKKPMEQPQPKVQEVLRNIIEMDKDDKLPQEKPAIQKTGIKPW